MATSPETKLDSYAASFLAADLDAWRAEIKQIDLEINKLQANRRAIEWKIATVSPVAPKPKPGNGVPVPASSDVATNTESQTGFRDQIRAVLRASARGLKPRQVAERLVAAGLQYHGKTDLNVRVNNDLHKLTANGSVKRRAGLYYINSVTPRSEPDSQKGEPQ
jgi:hypothetical protein